MLDENLTLLYKDYDLRVTGPFKIDRSPLCNIALTDGYVSNVHCSLNISRENDSRATDEAKSQVLITDLSSNGTWISFKTSDCAVKLEKGKSTLLEDGDKVYTQKAEVQSASVKKVRFKLRGEEFFDNTQVLMEYPDRNHKQSKERNEVYNNDFSFKNTDTERSTVDGSSNVSLSVDETNDFEEGHGKRGEVHTSTSQFFVCSSKRSHSRSYVSKVPKNTVEHDLPRPPEKVANHLEPKRTSIDSAPGDSVDCAKCTHCEKWIPRVTISLHEAVCEGQSLEAKSQDHISSSSLPLDTSLGGEDSNAEIQNSVVELVEGEPCTVDTSIESMTRESDRAARMTRVHDELCEKKTPAIKKTSFHHSGKCTEPKVIDKSIVTSCNSRREKEVRVEENPVTKISCPAKKAQKLSSDSLRRVTTPILPPESESGLERVESKERCTFCSKFLPVSELIEHVSECSKLSACAALGDTENIREACPYCGENFKVLQLVEHVSHCKHISRRIAEEVSQEDDASTFSSSEEDESDFIEESPEKELCPKCGREFPILELVSHAAECKEEEMGSDFGSLRGNVDKEDVRRFDDRESKDNTGDGEGSDIDNENADKTEINDHGCYTHETLNNEDVDIEEKQLGSSCDKEEVIRGGVTENEEGTGSDKADDSRRVTYEDSTTSGDSYHHNENERNESEKADATERISRRHEYALRKIDSDTRRTNCSLSEHQNDDCIGAVVAAEGDVGSDEYEFCPNCRKLFHLSLLIEHASNCTSVVDTEAATSGKDRISTDSLTLTLVDCVYCGIRLPVDVMSSHFPKCEKYHSNQGTGARPEKRIAPVGDSLACVKLVNNLSSGLSVGGIDLEHQASSSEKKTVLVEHASVCSSLQLNTTSSNDLEQCYYCLRTFPLNELIDHAPNCEQRTIQEDAANSQPLAGEPLERCMYCFRDFPIHKLIRHSQKCDGDMSGPRERFQGFLPSVHDLSAISSVAILNDTQRDAVEYVITRSAQDSKTVASTLLARVKRLGYSENDLKRTLQWVRSAAPIIIHVNLDRVLKFLVDDTHYRNRFETGTSGGSTDIVARKSWEDRIFNSAYHDSNPSERVKYGVLNIVGDPRGVRSCIHYGDSFL
ncbi:hypothetical protein pdam_00018200, partial [Pocillopora damicornis]